MSKYDVIDVIKMIAFKTNEKGSINLETEWQDYKNSQVNEYDFDVIEDHREFVRRLEEFIDDTKKEEIKKLLAEDSVLFQSVVNCFGNIDSIGAKQKIQRKQIKDITILGAYDSLKKNGIAKIEGLFSEQDLSTLCQFQDTVTEYLKDDIKHSGFIGLPLQFNPQANALYFGMPHHTKVEPNYGNTRLGSKGWPAPGGSQIFHPGSEVIRNNSVLMTINQLWFNNDNIKPWRMTMDWIYPAEINHNTWHLDKIRKVTKAFVLLDDVTMKNGPMYFAKGSQGINNQLELDVKHALFVHENKDMCIRNGERYGSNLAAHKGIHAGSLPDNLADNNSREVTTGKVELAECTYDKELMLGKKGDVILFETAGFHRGNYVEEGCRKTIYLTYDHDATYLGKFLDHIGKSKF